ncbi:MAG: primosomal protein N' [Clostridia bacterium]|nr:primosomal protein N' [Clostridia bacterium]
MIAEVIVDVAHSEVDKIFDYLCDDSVQAGCRVTVPFGRTYVAGFVMRIKPTSDFPNLKRIAKVFDELPAINPECLSLTQKIADRYHVPKALVLRLFLPAEMRTGKVSEVYKTYAELIDENAQIPVRATAQRGVVDYLKSHGKTPCSLLRERFSSAVNALEKKGVIQIYRERVQRSPYGNLALDDSARTLTDEQQAAVQSIQTSEKTVQLLHGVTGSGKTEIYLNLIAKNLQEGKSAIFLVPEISLTPQMLSQLRSRFGSAAAILHSGLSVGERFDEWWRLRSGEAKIAIGARSAVFAPLENLGIIVIDEEHDGSYSSETSPRYNTFDIARLRAEYNGCKLVLGSATPSVETYLHAQEGEYNLIKLTKRINRRPMPEITVADMRREVKKGNNSFFSADLQEELERVLSDNNQAILFLNRRGYSRSVICTECGYVAKCESCDVALTYHHEEKCLKCHYCGARYRMLSACPECSGKRLNYTGTGTERVVEELNKIFPSARILRMDNDTVAGKEGHFKILHAFAEGKADILVGTQMIAKGHDFPSVTLVGILDADMSLHFSDYRSGERTFQLITQVAGRSGRGQEKGKVVLQTYDPENTVLRHAIAYDYEGFYQNEISLRRATAFPPFALIVRVMVSAEHDQDALEGLKKIYFPLEKLYLENTDKFLFFNKMHSPIKRIQNRHRYQVLMRLTDASLLPQIYAVCAEYKDKHVTVYVEENPANLS